MEIIRVAIKIISQITYKQLKASGEVKHKLINRRNEYEINYVSLKIVNYSLQDKLRGS